MNYFIYSITTLPNQISFKQSFAFRLSLFLIVPALLFIASVTRAEQPAVENQNAITTNNVPPGMSFLHISTVENITDASTYIDHPLANGKPNARLQVTQNFNPNGSNGNLNNLVIGVWYDESGGGRWAIYNKNGTNMEEGLSFNVFIPDFGQTFIGTVLPTQLHVSDANNVSGHTTEIDHPHANDNSNALILVTHNWNNNGAPNHDHPIGVRYSNTTGRWSIFNQGGAIMGQGVAFNILILESSSNSFVQSTKLDATGFSEINHPLANGNPDAILHITQNWNPNFSTGKNNNHNIGVRYSSETKRWSIFNQDGASIDSRVAFNVFVPVPDSPTFVHRATVNNISNIWTEIDHPLANDNPHAILQVTQNFNPEGFNGTINNRQLGVRYTNSTNRWAIFNQDFLDMPEGAAFNVTIPSQSLKSASFIHLATGDNSSGQLTAIDHPFVNSNPNAILQVTQNLNPFGDNGGLNNHPIMAFYHTGIEKWVIVNQDGSPINEGVAFNIYATSAENSLSAFIHSVPEILPQGTLATIIDHPLANNNPSAKLQVTLGYDAFGNNPILNQPPIAVQYSDVDKRWRIFNQDISPIPPSAIFNVHVLGSRLLGVDLAGDGSGNVKSFADLSKRNTFASIDCGAVCSSFFYNNEAVILEAKADAGSKFIGWSGACSGTDECHLAMNYNIKSVTATFEAQIQEVHELQVNLAGNGQGAVNSTPAGINCGADCSESYPPDTEVTLTVHVHLGSTFVGWSGQCSGTGNCVVTMDNAKNVTANFATTGGEPGLFEPALLVSLAGTGSGEVTSSPAGINCGTICTHNYSFNSVVTLTAVPAEQSTFIGWTGACAGQFECVITMDEVKNVTASFLSQTSGEPNGAESTVYLPLIMR